MKIRTDNIEMRTIFKNTYKINTNIYDKLLNLSNYFKLALVHISHNVINWQDTTLLWIKVKKVTSFNSSHPLTKDELFLFLCVDDGALIFTNRSDSILGSNIAFTQMERMGMNMHVRNGENKSKTEAVFFPSRKTM